MNSLEAIPKPRYLVAPSWGHIFEGFGEREVRFVFDRKACDLTCLEIKRGEWQPATRIQWADVQDSLLNANSEALGSPVEYGLIEVDQLPGWAFTPDNEKECRNG